MQWRDSCIKEIGRNQRRIKSLLLFEGISFPGRGWGRTTITNVKNLKCRQAVGFKINALLEVIEEWRKQLKANNVHLQEFVKSEPEVMQNITYLMSVGYIGLMTAIHFLARIGDWRQLGRTNQTCGFLGLVPSEHSTGERVIRGRITGIGDRRLRSKLIQGSWRAVQKDQEFKEYFNKIARTESVNGSKKAIVAVTRKRVARMHAVLRDQRIYSKKEITIATGGRFPGTDPLAPKSEGISKVPQARLCRKGSREFAPSSGAYKTQCDGQDHATNTR
jgi:hypothetical protein